MVAVVLGVIAFVAITGHTEEELEAQEKLRLRMPDLSKRKVRSKAECSACQVTKDELVAGLTGMAERMDPKAIRERHVVEFTDEFWRFKTAVKYCRVSHSETVLKG
eukprot:Hpha_TRINITY_DN8045_c0_g1::TRINITY_DN8045_c0_g1_i2::g.140248::m.140248